LNTEKILLDNHEAQLTVEVDDETFSGFKVRAAKQLARHNKIPGFRPGKAPYNMIVRHLGEAPVIEKAVDILVDDLYPKLIKEQELQPYGPGELKEIKQLTPPVLVFTVPLAPRVSLGDYRSLKKDYAPPVVDDKGVEEAIQFIREQRAVTEPVERPARPGDLLYASITGRDRAAPEAEPLIQFDRVPIIIESGDSDVSGEWPFPGFAGGLAGMTKGEEKSFDHEYPAEFERDEDLAGKHVDFTVKALEIHSRNLPNLDDEFARSAGEYNSLDEMRADAWRGLSAEAKESYHSEFDSNLLDEVVALSEIHYPPQMVEDEVNSLMEDFKHRLSHDGWDLDMYTKAEGKSEEDIRNDFQETAIRRIRRGLVLMELANAEDIEISVQDVTEGVQRTLNVIESYMEPRERRKFFTQDRLRGLVSSRMQEEMTSRTLARLRSIVTGIPEETPETGDGAPLREETDTGEQAAPQGDTPSEETSNEEK
jgi:trigger factor